MADLVVEENNVAKDGSKSDEAVPVIQIESEHQGCDTNDTHRCSSNEDNEEDVASVFRKSDENEFSIKTSRDDFILRVEDKSLHVNKTVLCLFSSVFDDMLNGEFKDKYADELALTGKKYGDVLEFLQCMYPNILKPVTIENVNVVLPLAHEYHVTTLKNACELCLLRHLSRKEVPEDLYETLEKACYYQLIDVKEKCIDIVSERPHEDYEEAESKFTFSDDVGNTIRKKILQNLKLKYKDVFGHVERSRALYRFLGAVAKQKELLNHYIDGKVDGNYTMLVASVKCNETANMQVVGVPFEIKLKQTYDSTHYSALFTSQAPGFGLPSQAPCFGLPSQRKGFALPSKAAGVCYPTRAAGVSVSTCLCAVIIHNHEQRYEDQIYMERRQFERGSTSELELTRFTSAMFNDAHSGFCRDGKIELHIYMFKY